MLPSLGGYITADGSVNLARVEAIVARIGLVEDNIFRRRAIEDRKFESYKRQQEVSGALRRQLMSTWMKEVTQEKCWRQRRSCH